MNINDAARKMAMAIKQSDEYKNYKIKHDNAFKSSESKKMIVDYRNKMTSMQKKYYDGAQIDESAVKRIKELENILMSNKTTKEFFEAEAKVTELINSAYNVIYNDVYIK
ncbi:YlbF family regulator [Clostridiaceae bacterium M8S5]|nr:YlbF family regulator [Clostridiaceae bacterium M8S5]